MSRLAPRRVLYVAWAPFFSGAERALVSLVTNLDPSRYCPVVAVGTHGQLEAELKGRGIRTLHIPIVYSSFRTMPGWLGSVGRFIVSALREGVAIVHSNDVPSFQPAGYAARLLRLPIVSHVRFPDSRAGFEWFLKPGFDRALFVSKSLRDSCVEEVPELFEERGEVVHDCARMPDLPDEGGVAALRRELGLPVEGRIVALTGQVSEIKGIWDFLDAARILLARGEQVLFVVLGDDLKGKGALRRQAQELAAQKRLDKRVHFLGFRPDAPRLIPAFDVIAVPSHVEPFGLAALEAMAVSRPVVASDTGGLREIVADGVTGTLVPARDAGQLADAIEVFLSDPARAAAFGRAGRSRAVELFSESAHAARVQGVYDRLITAAGSPSHVALP